MHKRKLAGLFINCIKAQDSIYESGRMVFECLSGAEKYSLDYIEITPDNVKIPIGYDFYLFNYHMVTMAWLNTSALKKSLPGVKLTIVLEVAPNDPFVFCSPGDFDAYCVLDPTLNIENEKVFAFPRPLETIENLSPHQAREIPVIGSFGFATTGKGFEHLIDAVSREFEQATVRINIPYATYADESREYAEHLAEMCRRRAKKGIEVVVTHDFMSKPDLIEWCGENTLNCFLYDRNMPGLAATTDQAIASGRPLAVSKNNTFRHIQKYVKPFPYQTLREAIEKTEKNVGEMQNDWSPLKFREKFEEVLENFRFGEQSPVGKTIDLKTNKNPAGKTSLYKEIFRRLKKISKIPGLPKKAKSKFGRKKTYSQFGEDRIIFDLLNELKIQNIFYLDIGANNPKYISNTFLFYENGRRGVLIEPNRNLCAKLKAARPRDTILNVGIGTNEGETEADFYQFPAAADGLSTFSADEARHWETVGMGGKKFKVEKIIKMPLININDVIAEYFTECPDFISIDVEGWDLAILKTLDFEKYSPAVFCVETLAYKPDGSTYRIQEIYEFFAGKNYFSFHETYANNVFVNKNLYDFYLYQKNQNDDSVQSASS